jgi:hypothetical protein
MHITQNEGSDYHSEILQESIQCVSSHKLQRNLCKIECNLPEVLKSIKFAIPLCWRGFCSPCETKLIGV